MQLRTEENWQTQERTKWVKKARSVTGIYMVKKICFDIRIHTIYCILRAIRDHLTLLLDHTFYTLRLIRTEWVSDQRSFLQHLCVFIVNHCDSSRQHDIMTKHMTSSTFLIIAFVHMMPFSPTKSMTYVNGISVVPGSVSIKYVTKATYYL